MANTDLFKKSREIFHQFNYARVDLIKIQNNIKKLEPKYIRQVVNDAQALKGKWIEVIDEECGIKKIYHCLNVLLPLIIPFLEPKDNNIFTDRIKISYDVIAGILDGKNSTYVSSKPRETYLSPMAIMRCRIVPITEIRKNFKELRNYLNNSN